MATFTIYCASSSTLAPKYIEAAAALGRACAQQGIAIVTGGGYTGLMGAVADASLAAGGTVTGIIPEFMLQRGWQHKNLSELRIVPDMHRRKETMAALASAAIALPGGIGTFEELLEIITWRQLGLFAGNVVIYNVDGYYDPLLAMLDRAVAEHFMRPDHQELYTVATTLEEVMTAALAAPQQRSWSPKF